MVEPVLDDFWTRFWNRMTSEIGDRETGIRYKRHFLALLSIRDPQAGDRWVVWDIAEKETCKQSVGLSS